MQKSSKIQSSEYTDLNKVIGWFILLRWIAAIGVFIALVSAKYNLHLNLPYNILFILNGLLFVVNGVFTIYFSVIKKRNLSRKEMSLFFHIQVCCDYSLLFFLVYFTGYLENPFIYYFVFHVMLTSFIFPSSVVIMYVSVLICFFWGILSAQYFSIIPHYTLGSVDGSLSNEFIIIRAVGLCSTLIFTAYLLINIKNRIEEKGKRVEIELDRYKSLDKAKSNFILQVTHELRGPLAALMGYHEMVMKGITGDISQGTQEVIVKANRRTENLLTMIDEMLDYAYMKSNDIEKYTFSRIQLKTIIKNNLDLIDNQAHEKGILLTSNCPKDLMVLANRDLLNIILSNVLSNSLRYSSKGSITVNATAEDEKIHVLIKDEGMGIESSELVNIFEEFYRTRRAREIEKDGTGLGLSIVQKAVEKLNGHISLYSEIGKGTTFHLYLPQYNLPDNSGRE